MCVTLLVIALLDFTITDKIFIGSVWGQGNSADKPRHPRSYTE